MGKGGSHDPLPGVVVLSNLLSIPRLPFVYAIDDEDRDQDDCAHRPNYRFAECHVIASPPPHNRVHDRKLTFGGKW